MKRKFIAILLTLSMLLSLLPMTAVQSYAADEEEESSSVLEEILPVLLEVLGSETADTLIKQIATEDSYSKLADRSDYDTYLSIGDSLTMGYGLGNVTEENLCWGKTDPKAWTYLLADKMFPTDSFGTSTDITPTFLEFNPDNGFISMAAGGFRSWEVNYLLGDSESLDGYSRSTILKKYGAATFTDMQTAMQDAVKEADLITLQIGGNDVNVTELLNAYLMDGSDNTYLNWDYLGNDATVQKFESVVEALVEKVLEIRSENLEYALVVDIIKVLTYQICGFVLKFDDIADRIHELNGDATLVIVGIPDSYRQITVGSEALTGGKTIALGNLISLIPGLFNSVMKYYAMENSDWCCYVNTFGVETFADKATETNFNFLENSSVLDAYSANDGVFLHPTEAGHEEIAGRVKAVIKENTSVYTDHATRVKNLLAAIDSDLGGDLIPLKQISKVIDGTASLMNYAEKIAESRKNLFEKREQIIETGIAYLRDTSSAVVMNTVETIDKVTDGALSEIADEAKVLQRLIRGFVAGFTK